MPEVLLKFVVQLGPTLNVLSNVYLLSTSIRVLYGAHVSPQTFFLLHQLHEHTARSASHLQAIDNSNSNEIASLAFEGIEYVFGSAVSHWQRNSRSCSFRLCK